DAEANKPGIRCRIRECESPTNGRHLGLRIVERCSGPEPPHDAPPVAEAIRPDPVPDRTRQCHAHEGRGLPELNVLGRKIEGRRHDSDHLEDLSVDLHTLSDSLSRGPKASLP